MAREPTRRRPRGTADSRQTGAATSSVAPAIAPLGRALVATRSRRRSSSPRMRRPGTEQEYTMTTADTSAGPAELVDSHHHIWRVADLPWLSGAPVPRIFGPYEPIDRKST